MVVWNSSQLRKESFQGNLEKSILKITVGYFWEKILIASPSKIV
jgi:hypothetical protein